ncbi:MAG: hypothetical protein ACR2IH_13440 [Pyrinomonadaceae bacterium]
MKLAYRVFIATLVLITLAFAVSAQTTTGRDNSKRSAKDPRNTAPTVGTGGPMGGATGLFTVYDGQTLRKGEFTFSIAYSNFDRDPGNADFVEVPASFQIGVTNNIELFFNTDAYRAVKVNSPRNLSGFYLPNSRVFINGAFRSAPAIILSPAGSGTSFLPNSAIFRPTGTSPFCQFPYNGCIAGTTLNGVTFGFPSGGALTGSPRIGGNGADNFPGVGSVYGSILPGVVLQTVPAATVLGGELPTVFTLAPSYLPDAPFINRTYGESAFNTFTAGGKFRLTNVNSPVGAGFIAAYRFYADSASDASGFNQLQRGASPGGKRGDVLVTAFADARLRKWANLSANVGYHWNSSVKNNGFTLLDRPDELLASIGVDFPVNKYFQPIAEFRTLRYVGGRTPNAFENNPKEGLIGARIFPVRWAGVGFWYRHHFNQQDRDSFDRNTSFSSSVLIPCTTQGCTPTTIRNSFTGIPQGFNPSSDPHGFGVQAWIGRRNKRQAEIVNQFANVTALTLSDTTITLPCRPGFRPREGTACNDATTISVQTTAVDPENDVLTYNYTVSGGRIVGTGANVSWDVGGLAPGTYTIVSGVDDGCGLCGKTETKTITIAECDCVQACDCATLSVSGPAGITEPGSPMTFTANMSGGMSSNVTYNWTVSSGTIESGQGTPSITVNTDRSMAGGNVTATVNIGGTDPTCNCQTSASETAPVATPAGPVMTDEFGALSNDDVKSRLDNFFSELANNPNNQGYIINYGTDREIAAREKVITSFIGMRKFDRSRITLVRGGASPDGVVHTKLYRIPPGAENPAP